MTIDINDLRSAVTVAGFVLFLALVRWVWASRRRAAFDAAAQLPFEAEQQSAARPPEGAHSPLGGSAAGRRGQHE
jgi:cytochrome c oxidase cbb3-type subunit 4